MNTHHSTVRAQQRGVPPLIQQWLLEYGEESHDGRGAVRRYFSHRSVRIMERRFGRRVVRKLGEYLCTYLVESSDGHIVTVGHRTGRVKHR